MLLKVRTDDTRALERLLAHLYEITGVEATRTYIVLSTHLERPVQPDSTTDWQVG
jgi:Lrp/AsnC family transcriptional regulator, leucine-responsive regulatory protein